LINIPDNYKVLFMQGGASSQFSMVPINLLHGKTKANYAHTGHWSNKRRLHQYANAQNQQYWYIYYPSYPCKYSHHNNAEPQQSPSLTNARQSRCYK
jgi:phosphoserine aminotransferase